MADFISNTFAIKVAGFEKVGHSVVKMQKVKIVLLKRDVCMIVLKLMVSGMTLTF